MVPGARVTGSCQSLKVFDGNKDACAFCKAWTTVALAQSRTSSQIGVQAAFLPHLLFPCLAERKTCSWPQCQFYPVDCPCPTDLSVTWSDTQPHHFHRSLKIVVSGPLVLSKHDSIYPFGVE